MLLRNFATGPFSLPSVVAKSSWKLMRPMRATASTVVMARAETHIVRTQAEMSAGSPKVFVRKPATAPEKSWNGVPEGSWPVVEAAAQTMVRARAPRTHSTSMAP